MKKGRCQGESYKMHRNTFATINLFFLGSFPTYHNIHQGSLALMKIISKIKRHIRLISIINAKENFNDESCNLRLVYMR